MLDTDTKRRIDSARDILVGKVPDPKSQVEQITIALIYKFMDDMDAESEEFGGVRKFFANEFARYGWARLMHSGLGGFETLNLYAEAISKMPENPGIPLLFRDIFKNTYLPYRDPETLKIFLKVIDEFTYDHSEKLGDAFEYLLSVLGSQGDAGQFRTPRHIIDFMVEVIDPKKTETVLDPACGTAGFLISSYKHILKANTDAGGNSSLMPDERGRLAHNFRGYDISPDMVRLSLVNMYLHGFVDPHIYEYDTLSSLERWNEYADVILANPPFMSPKGGITPHKRFSVQSKRSEVLFVDYMAEHLTPGGRAGIIVPEGIIFQSGTAYKQLRKMLVENYLVAVVSLPAGVFNPYAGVKTSILILDKALAKKSRTIAFFKVENDGFGLGAQRREIDKNDLPQVRVEIGEYLHRLRAGEPIENFQPTLGLIVEREKIAANGDYNLSGERYRVESIKNHVFPMVFLGDSSLFRVEAGGTPKSDVEKYWNGEILWATLVDLPATDFITQITKTQRMISEAGLKESSAKMIPSNSVIVSTRATIGRIAINRVPIATNQGFKNIVIEDVSRAVPEYVALALTKLVPTMEARATGGTFKEISKSKFCELSIPLPPLKVQQEIVAEIEGYQKVIKGARAVLENYSPHIPVNPDWPMVELGDACTVLNGSTPSRQNPCFWDNGTIPWFTIDDIRRNGRIIKETIQFITEKAVEETSIKLLPVNTVLLCCTASVGENAFTEIELTTNQQFNGLVVKDCYKLKLFPKFLFHLSAQFKNELIRLSGKTSFNFVSGATLKMLKFPLPPLTIQQAIVSEIEAEQSLVAANRELIARFEKKIQATLVRVWGEGKTVKAEASYE